MVAHSAPIFGVASLSGRTAVQCFFVISGFYMAMVLERKYLRIPRGGWRTFMVARAMRLFPVYILVAILSLLFVLLGGKIAIGEQQQLVSEIFLLPAFTWLPLVASNVALVTQDIALFMAIDASGSFYFTPAYELERKPAYLYYLVPQAWTIALELTFYAIAPWLARRSSRTLLLLLAGSLYFRAIFAVIGLRGDPWSYRFFPFELAFFLAGMLVYRFRANLQFSSRRGPAVVVGLALIALPTLEPLGPFYTLLLVLFPLVFSLAIPHIFNATKDSRVDRWIGEMSYPMYMVHVLVIIVMITLGVPITGISAVLAVFLVTVLLVLAFDHPVERSRHLRLRTSFERNGFAEPGDERAGFFGS